MKATTPNSAMCPPIIPEPLFGKEIKRYRAMFGMTQKEYADMLGISSSRVSAIENDRGKASATLSVAIRATARVWILQAKILNFEV